MRKSEITFIVFIIFCLLSCKDNLGPCSNVICLEGDQINFTFVDETGKSLIGSDRKYNPDSVIFFNNVDSFYTKTLYDFTDTIQTLFLKRYSFSEEIFVKLDSTDYDTIHFYTHDDKGGCCTSFLIDSVQYRNEPVKIEVGDYREEFSLFEKR